MKNELIFPRALQASLFKWIDRREAYAIKGPRQSGKTTLLRILEQRLAKKDINTVFLNFEDPDVLEAFETNPREYVRSFLLRKGRYCFLMDEYHYVKDAGKKLKLLYDTFEDVKFIVTGSSSLELSGAMAKFLVGRVFFFELFPFSFHEFLTAKNPRLAKVYEDKNRSIREFLLGKEVRIGKDIFIRELEPLFGEYVMFGGYPAVIKAEDAETKKMILKGIYDTYISKDVVSFLKITDALKYRHVVRSLALLAGNLINYNELCSACQVYYKELKHIISILSETYIINLLRPFYKNPVTELKKQPKPYFLDLGLRNYIADNFNPLDKRTDAGALVENFAFLSLRNYGAVNYWRTTAKAEVDFVLSQTMPVEVKYQHFTEPKVSRSLRSFISSYRPKAAVVATKDFWAQATVDKTNVLFVPVCYL